MATINSTYRDALHVAYQYIAQQLLNNSYEILMSIKLDQSPYELLNSYQKIKYNIILINIIRVLLKHNRVVIEYAIIRETYDETRMDKLIMYHDSAVTKLVHFLEYAQQRMLDTFIQGSISSWNKMLSQPIPNAVMVNYTPYPPDIPIIFDRTRQVIADDSPLQENLDQLELMCITFSNPSFPDHVEQIQACLQLYGQHNRIIANCYSMFHDLAI